MLLLLFAATLCVYAERPVYIELSAGFSLTDFDWKQFADAEMNGEAARPVIAACAAYPVMDYLLTGAGFEYVFPYRVELMTPVPELMRETRTILDISQIYLGLFNRYHFQLGSFGPYVQAGVGYYMGNTQSRTEMDGQTLSDITLDVKSAPGVNAEIGCTWKHFSISAVYHMVQRKKETDGIKSGMNTWNIRLGYHPGL
jgi:hypothetical protein